MVVISMETGSPYSIDVNGKRVHLMEDGWSTQEQLTEAEKDFLRQYLKSRENKK